MSALLLVGLLAACRALPSSTVVEPGENPTLSPTESAGPPASPTASPRPTARPADSPTPIASPSPSAKSSRSAVTGCFEIGEDEDDEQPVEPIVAESLRDRLPILDSPFSQPMAYVGTSVTTGLGAAYLDGFESCTGTDRAAMRFGWVQNGATLGVIPMAVEIDGYSGWELAELMIDGNSYQPDLRSELRTGEHGGWTYLYTDGLAVTASAQTMYFMQSFCCVDVVDDDAELPTFEEIVTDYLDRTRDMPAPMPES